MKICNLNFFTFFTNKNQFSQLASLMYLGNLIYVAQKIYYQSISVLIFIFISASRQARAKVIEAEGEQKGEVFIRWRLKWSQMCSVV